MVKNQNNNKCRNVSNRSAIMYVDGKHNAIIRGANACSKKHEQIKCKFLLNLKHDDQRLVGLDINS